MGLENSTTISGLNSAFPLGTDPKSEGDDHLRLVKSVLQLDALTQEAVGVITINTPLEGDLMVWRTNEWVNEPPAPGAASEVKTGFIQAYFGDTLAGWLALDGTTIGSGTSLANHADAAYEALFTHLWNSLADAQAPVTGGRGIDAATDFAADKVMTMPNARGRTPLGAGTGPNLSNRIAGDIGGSQDSTALLAHDHGGGSLAAASDGAHSHVQQAMSTGGGTVVSSIGDRAQTLVATVSTQPAGEHTHTISGTTGSTGSGNPVDANLGPWFAVHWFIKV